MKLARLSEAQSGLYRKNLNLELMSTGRRIDKELRLIPWREIRLPLSIARIRNRSGIVDTFFEVLLEESLFDDQGAWWEPSQLFPKHAKKSVTA